jgi:hypothetical protein
MKNRSENEVSWQASLEAMPVREKTKREKILIIVQAPPLASTE